MPLDKWNPLKELDSMRREMDRIWEDLFPQRRAEAPWKRPVAAPDQATATPAIDILDRAAEIVVRAEMPGVKKDDIEISLQDGTLTIKGEIKEEGQKEGNYSYSERNYRYFARSLTIPFKIRQDGIKATLKDGVLSIELPKVLEEQTRKITVEVS